MNNYVRIVQSSFDMANSLRRRLFRLLLAQPQTIREILLISPSKKDRLAEPLHSPEANDYGAKVHALHITAQDDETTPAYLERLPRRMYSDTMHRLGGCALNPMKSTRFGWRNRARINTSDRSCSTTPGLSLFTLFTATGVPCQVARNTSAKPPSPIFSCSVSSANGICKYCHMPSKLHEIDFGSGPHR